MSLDSALIRQHSAIQFLAQGKRVLTASRRLAHALRLEYGRGMHAQGHRVWHTPDVLPLGTGLRQLWGTGDVQGRPAQRLLSDSQSRVLWRQAIESGPHSGQVLDAAKTAGVALRSWQRVHEYQIPLAEIAEYATEEARAWSEWAASFMQVCERGGWMEESLLPAHLTSRALLPDKPLLLAGFDQLPPAVQALMDVWRNQISVEVEAPRRPANTIIAISAFDRDAELELAAQWAREQLQEGVASAAVLIPDLSTRAAAVRRVFDGVFAPYSRFIGASSADNTLFAIAASTALSEFPVIHAASLCLTLARGGADSLLAGEVLRTPFLRAGGSEAALRAAADVRLRETFREHWNMQELERWCAVTGCTELELAARSALFTLREFRSTAVPSEWARRFLLLLSALGWPGERALDSAEQQTVAKFHEVLGGFGALDDLLPPLDFRRAVREFDQLLAETQFEPQTPDAPVLVIDPDTAAGMSFHSMWITGIEASKWPPPAEPDAFIPVELQRKYGVPEASSSATFSKAQRRLDGLLGAGQQVVVSWPTRDGDTVIEPSPLISAYRGPVAEEQRAGASPRPPQTLFAARPPLQRVTDERMPAIATRALARGSYAVELQSRCPFRAQAELRLNATPLSQMTVQITPQDRGVLVHRVLQALWSELEDQAGLQRSDDVVLHARIFELASRHAARLIPVTSRVRERLVAIEVEWISRRIMQLLAEERRRAPFRVRRAEQDETLPIGGYTLRIQPDRIDELDDGTRVIIDYKTGAAFQPGQWLDRTPGRPSRPQLPLYALAYRDGLAALAVAVIAPGAAEFRGFARQAGLLPNVGDYPRGVRDVPASAQNWDALQTHWHAVLEEIVSSYAQGHARVDPLPQECRTCHLMSLCRIKDQPANAESGEFGEEGGDD